MWHEGIPGEEGGEGRWKGEDEGNFYFLARFSERQSGLYIFLPQMSPVLQGNTALSLAHRSKEMRKFVFTEVVSKPPQNSPGPCPA